MPNSEASVSNDPDSLMRLGSYQFAINVASFRYIASSDTGPGWDFDFSGPCINDDPQEPVFPYGARLYTEIAPLPLDPVDDFTGIVLDLPRPFDEDTGEPLFGLKVWEEHDVSNLMLRFVEKRGHRYRIEITALVADTVFGHPEQLSLSAWTERLPDRST